MNSQDYSLVRLFNDEDTINDIVNHIIDLPLSDRYLRFGYNAPLEQIQKYVATSISTTNSRKISDFWFGIKSYDILIGTMHVSISDDVAELAFTVSADYRGKKLGQLLFARGYQLVCEFQVSKIFMVCLSQNSAMRHIAKKFGMSVLTHGTDSEASVNISYPVPLSRVNEVTMSCIDKNLFEGKL
jgi:RimJ/RimL family protein N-acetyltransferase